MLILITYFFLISILLSVAANSRLFRRTRLGRWWRSRGVRLLLAAAGVAAGLILAGSGFMRLDWIDIFVGLVVAAIFARDLMAIRREPGAG
ncbi:MAG: hypothetical protein M5U01_28850 [Ardenticatenaceae bacterium]|nr:hypothetical protein [Ardenticatenaceae bacterium]HBY92674.1 hypothetical protein [Chloroflexota bacterium]